MKMRALLICFTFMTTSLMAVKPSVRQETTPIPEGPKIKVLLQKEVASAILEVRGNYKVMRRDTGSLLSFGSTGKRFVVHALQEGLRWGEEYPDVYQITVAAKNPETMIYVNGMQYKGDVSVYHDSDSRITIVNEVAIEDYVKSILALKFDKPISKEAMSALTIAARTEAYAAIFKNRSTDNIWDVKASDSSYFGFGVTKQQNGVDDAVDWTRFMVLESTKDGKPLQAVALSLSKAEELAKHGLDAKKILQSCCPLTKLSTTTDPEQFTLRYPLR